jgi:hypothetical protein
MIEKRREIRKASPKLKNVKRAASKNVRGSTIKMPIEKMSINELKKFVTFPKVE